VENFDWEECRTDCHKTENNAKKDAENGKQKEGSAYQDDSSALQFLYVL
jgi:hypothetical protein